MLQALATRNGLTSYAVTAVEDLDLPALLAMMDEAWQMDYRDQVRLAFDEAFLRWLMVEPVWVGILLCTPAGTPVGFEMALERTLYGQQQPFRAYYPTVFTVSARHRRRGLGRWLLEELNHQVSPHVAPP
jgi:ribosomal protein S18 acetylase RimI-like enzyme